MGLSLYNIFKAGLLLANSIAILHPKRFLAQYGYDKIDPTEGSSLRNQAVGFLQAAAYLKVPLIIVNVLVIMIELVAGG